MGRPKNRIVEKYEHEIAALVAKLEKDGRELVPVFITNELVQSHVDGLARANEHTPFFEHYTHRGVRAHVGEYLTKRYGGDGDEEPNILPGFGHLQRYYIIKRDGVEMPVRIEDVTPAELRAKAKMLRRRGTTCFAHADELDRYADIQEYKSAA